MGHLKNLLLLSTTFFFFIGCSPTENELLHRNSPTSIDNALVVWRINLVETYNDIETGELKIRRNEDLLNDQDQIKTKRVNRGQPELYRALHYLYKFRFDFTNSNGNDHLFYRFNLDLRGYESLAMYQFTPGEITLHNIDYKQVQLKTRVGPTKKTERFYPIVKNVSEEFATWQIEKGKIIYAGDLNIYFRTKREMIGIITPEEVNKSIRLERIELVDDFDSAKQELKEKKPWFPVDKMENRSKSNQWVYYVPPAEVPGLDESEEFESEDDSEPKQKAEGAFY